MNITRTLEVISKCWRNAEQTLQKEISNYYPCANEEFITQMFHGQFAKDLKIASQQKMIEEAYYQDLCNVLEPSSYDLIGVSNGLIAETVLHRRHTEGVTGGDIGLVITKPSVSPYSLEIQECRRGLLCQAKIKRANGEWGHFSDPQERVLPERREYLGLLLYEYRDAARCDLKPFQWQLCHNQHAQCFYDVKQWLKKGVFPSLWDSEQVLKGLGNDIIGTGDKDAIDKFIKPQGNAYLEIIIDWPDAKKPPQGSTISVHGGMNEVEDQQYVYNYQHV